MHAPGSRSFVRLAASILLFACVFSASVAFARDKRGAPAFNPEDFSPRVDHPYFPLASVPYAVLKGGGERVVRRVKDYRRRIAKVVCTVLTEESYEGGKLTEISYNYFATHKDGSVYYFGEEVDNYRNGKVINHGGAWLVGRNAKKPCLFFPADPKAGAMFQREATPPAAQEFDEFEERHVSLRTPYRAFTDVLVLRERDVPVGPWKERKYYVRGIGLVSENRGLNLTEVRIAGKKPGPLFSPGDFTSEITHPYFPISKVRRTTLVGKRGRIERSTHDETATIAGVSCAVLVEVEYQNGIKTEVALNFFAQHRGAGDVYYFGEKVREYAPDGTHREGSSWVVGEEASQPTLYLPAIIRPRQRWIPEWAPEGEQEYFYVKKLDAKLTFPFGVRGDVLDIKEKDANWKTKEHKYFLKGVGFASDNREMNLEALPVGKRD